MPRLVAVYLISHTLFPITGILKIAGAGLRICLLHATLPVSISTPFEVANADKRAGLLHAKLTVSVKGTLRNRRCRFGSSFNASAGDGSLHFLSSLCYKKTSYIGNRMALMFLLRNGIVLQQSRSSETLRANKIYRTGVSKY